MGRRTLTIAEVTEILRHWQAGRSQSGIASDLGLDRKTVRKYLQPARTEGLSPGSVSLTAQDWAALARTWFPELADALSTTGHLGGNRAAPPPDRGDVGPRRGGDDLAAAARRARPGLQRRVVPSIRTDAADGSDRSGSDTQQDGELIGSG